MKISGLLPLLMLFALGLVSCGVQSGEGDATEELPVLGDAGTVETITVDGMTCGNCVMHVHDALATLPGFVAGEIDLDSGEVRVGFEGEAPPQQEIVAVIAEAGYTVVEEK